MKIYQPKDYKGNKLVSEELLASKNYATKGEVEQKADQAYVDGELIKKADAAALEAHTSNDGIHVTLELKEKIDGQYSREETDALIASKAEQSEVDELTTKVNEKVDQTDFNELSDKVDSAVEDITSLQEETAKLPDITREIDSLKESKADQTALEQAKQELQEEITNRTESMFHYCGSVGTFADLEDKQATAKVGDVWNVNDTGSNYVWSGSDWDKLDERHDGLATKKELNAHSNNTDIHVGEGEKERWNDKYTKEETNAELAKKASIEDVTSLQSTVTELTERTETLESANDSTTETLETLASKDELNQYKAEAEGKFATKEEVTNVSGELDTVQSTVDSLQTQVTGLQTSKADATDLTKLTERVAKHEKDALKADSTFTFIPLVSTDCEEAESAECTGFTLANHLLTPGTISTLTLPGATENNACCNLFVSSDGVTWIKLASSSNSEEGTWTFDTAILPADLHLRCAFTESEITDGNVEGDTQVSVNVKKSKSEDTDKISAYTHDGESTPGVVCVTITFQQETSETVKEHITDGTKHLTENEKYNLQTLFSGYNGYSTLGDIEKKLNSAATSANLEELSRKVDQKADNSKLTELVSKVEKKADQSALDTLQAEVNGKASSAELAQVQADLADKASNSELKKVQDDLATKATTTALNSAKEELERQLGNKAEISVVELLQTKVSKLESATIEQQIPEHETSENAASAKAVADYVKSTKDELTTQIETKAGSDELKTVSDQVEENKGKLEGIESVIETLAGGSDVTALQQRVDQLEQNKVDNTKLTEVQQTLESSIATNKQSIDDINEQIDTMSESIGGELESLGERVTANETAIADKVGQTEYEGKVAEIEEQIKGKVSTEDFSTALDKKADTSYVDTELGKKANQTELEKVKEDLGNKATQESVTQLTTQVTELESTTGELDTRLQSLEGKEDPEVDQEYKPQSQNAQSGIAVAQGIKQATDSLATKTELTEGLSEKAEKTTVETLQSTVQTVQTNLTTHTQNNEIHVKSGEKDAWNKKVDQAALDALKTELTQTIESKVGSVFHWKGTVGTVEELYETQDPQVGDVWNVSGDGGANYVYSGTDTEGDTHGWDKLSEDLSGYAKSTELTQHTTDTNVHVQTTDRTKWDSKADQEDIDSAVEAAKTELNATLQEKADKTWVEKLTSGLPTDSKVQELSDKLEGKLDTTTYNNDKATFATKTELEDKVSQESLTEQLGSYVTQVTFDGHVEDSTKHPSQAKQAEWDAKIDTAGLSLALEAQESTFTSLLGLKANSKDLTDHTGNETIHLAEGDKAKWDAKLDASEFESYQETVTTALAGKADTGAYDTQIAELTQKVGSKADESKLTALSEKVEALKIPEVDQEYDGISTNAQSGTAVFGALKALKETLDGDLTDKLSGYATTDALQVQETTLNSAIEEAKTTASTALTTHINDEKKHPSEEKQKLWDAKVDETQLSESIEEAIQTYSAEVTTQLGKKVDYTEFNEHKTNETIHVTKDEKAKLADVITETEVDTKLGEYTKTSVLTTQLADKVSNAQLTVALADKIDQDALDEALATKANSEDLQNHIDQSEIHVTATEKKSWSDKVDTATLNGAISTVTSAVNAQIAGKANTTDLTDHTQNKDIHVGTGEKATWNAKADTTWVTTQISEATESFTEQLGTKANSEDLAALETQLASKAESSAVETLSGTVTTLDETVKDMKESIDALEAGTVQIDDKYDSTSGHAISGKGVADALSSYATSASVSSLETQVSSFQTKLDSKAESSKVTELEEQLATKLDESALTEKLADYVQSSELDDINQQLGEKASSEELSGHIANTTIHFTENEKKTLQGKVTAVETGLKSKAEASELTSLQDEVSKCLTKEEASTTYAKSATVTELQTEVGKKANQTEVTALTELVEGKVDKDGLDSAIETALEGYTDTAGLTALLEVKADKKDLQSLQTTVASKVDSNTLDTTLADYVKSDDLAEQLATKADDSDIESLQQALAGKVESTTLTETLEDYVKSTDFTKQLADKADASELTKYALKTTVDTLEGEVDANTASITSLTEQLEQKIDDTQLTKKLEPYTLKTEFTEHTTDQTDKLHITDQERIDWNAKVDTTLLDSTVQTGDNAVKEELGKQITALEKKIPIVDKVYNSDLFPTSENAQSGVTVKAALTELHDSLIEEIAGGDISLEGYATLEDLNSQKTTLDTSIKKAQTTADSATSAAQTAQAAAEAAQETATGAQEAANTAQETANTANTAAGTAQTTATAAQTAAEKAQSTADNAKTSADKANTDLTKHTSNNEIHVTAIQKTNWDAKIDQNSLDSAITKAKEDIQKTIDTAVGSVFTWKGSVDSLTELTSKDDAKVGDVWNVKEENGANYVYSGDTATGESGWDKLSENLDGLATKSEFDSHKNNNNLHFTDTEKNTWNSKITTATANITSLQSDVSGLQSTTGTLTTELGDLSDTVDGLSGNLNTVTQQVLGHNESIENLQKADQDFETKLADKATKDEVALKADKTALNNYAPKTTVDTLQETVDTLTETVSGKADTTALTKHTGDTGIHFTNKTEKTKWETDISSNKSGLSTLQGTVNTHIENGDVHFQDEEKETWNTNITQAKADITALQTKTSATDTALTGLQSTVETEQDKLKKHIADTTVAHFDEGEKASMKSSISTLETQIVTKVDQTAIDKAVASKAESTRVEEIGSDLQDLIDGIDHTWQSPESPLSEGLQTGVAVAGAVKEHEDKTDIHVTKAFKDSLATIEYVNSKTDGLASSGNIESLAGDIRKAQEDLESHTGNTGIHFENEEEKTNWTSKITQNEKNITTASASISDALGKYETLDATVKGIQSGLDDKADVTALASKADTSVTDSLSTRIDGIEKKIPEVEETYDGETFAESTNVPTGEVVSDAIEAALTSYATSASVTSEITSAVDAAKTEVKEELITQISAKASNTDLQNHIKDANAHFTDTEKTDLTKKVDKAVGDLDTVTKQVVEYGNTIETLQTKDDTLEASITSNTTNITALQGKVDNNTGEITTLKSQVSTLQGQVVTVDEEWTPETSPESVNAQSGVAVKGAIDEHKQEAGLHVTTELQTKWNQNSTDITALQKSVGDCALKSQLEQYVTSEKFGTLENKVNGQVETLEELQTTVDGKIGDTELQAALKNYTDTAGLNELLTGKVGTTEFQQLQDQVEQCETQDHASSTYATKTEVTTLSDQVKLKATQTEVDAIQEQLETYATTDSVNTLLEGYTNTETLTGLLEKKADKTQITTLEGKLANKVDSSTLTTTLEDYVTDTELSEALSGKVDTSALTSYATTASVTALEKKVEGNTTNITDITSKLDDKVDNSELETLLDPFALKTALTAHENDKVAHVTKDERTKWDGKVDEEHLNSVVTTAVGAAKNELNQEITRVEDSIPEVDQEWTPETSEESVNAQSGVSVKGALDALHKTIQGEISTVDGKLSGYATTDALEQQNTTLTASIKQAQDTADAAKTAAQAAQTAADGAQSAADTAQSSADAAQETAAGAQEAANTAQDTADTAQETADAANTAAGKAQSTADGAKTAADKANTDLTTHKNDKTVHVTSTQTSGWDAKIDQNGLDSAISKAKEDIQKEYQKAIDTAVGSVFTWKGSVDDLTDLTSKSDAKVGDVYNVKNENGANYVYSGDTDGENKGWDKLSENLEGLASKSEFDNHKEDSSIHFTSDEKSTWNSKITSATSNITTLQSDVSNLKSTTGTLTTGLSDLNNTVEGLSGNLDNVTKQVLSHNDSIEKLQEADQNFETELADKVTKSEVALKADKTALNDYALKTTVTALQGTVSTLQTTVGNKADASTLTSHTGDTDIHFESKTEKDQWNTDISSNKSKLAELEGEFNTHAESTDLHFADGEKDEWEGNIQANTTGLAALQKTVEGHGTSITALQAKDTEIDKALQGKANTSDLDAKADAKEFSTLQSTVLSVSGNVEKLQVSVKTLETTTGDLESTVSGLESTVSELETTVDSKAESSALTAHTGDKTAHFTGTEKNEWKTKIDKTATDLASTTKQVVEYGNTIETLQEADQGFTASIGTINLSLEDAKSSIESLQADVLALQSKPDAIVDTVFQGTSDNAQSGKAIQGELAKYATVSALNLKADESDLQSLTTTVNGKLDTSKFNTEIKKYALESKVTEISESLSDKADSQALSALETQVETNETAISSLASEIESDYLTIAEAELTYLKITNAESTYLTISEANSDYLKRTEAEMDYVKKTEFNELQTRVNANAEGLTKKLNIDTFNTTIARYVKQETYDELQKQLEALREEFDELKSKAVTSTMVKHLAVYVNPDEAPPLESRDADTLYLVGSGSK